MFEVEYSVGPRILDNGVNLDADFRGRHPVIQHREITDPVSDGSLGPGYAAGQQNKDGSQI